MRKQEYTLILLIIFYLDAIIVSPNRGTYARHHMEVKVREDINPVYVNSSDILRNHSKEHSDHTTPVWRDTTYCGL